MLAAHIAESKQSQRAMIQGRARDPESLDPTPVAIPIDNSPPSIREMVYEYVQGALSQQAHAEDLGTFEEEDDFEEEDPDLLDLSGFEIHDYELVDELPLADAAPPPAAPGEPNPLPEPEPAPVETEATP